MRLSAIIRLPLLNIENAKILGDIIPQNFALKWEKNLECRSRQGRRLNRSLNDFEFMNCAVANPYHRLEEKK